MKGPGLRIGLDVRRVWRCARCGRTVRTAGQVVAQRCGCSETGHWMVLEPPVKREPFCPPVREPLFDPGADEQLATAPSALTTDALICGAAVPAAAAQPELPQDNPAERPIADEQSPAEESSPAIETAAGRAEPAPEPPAAAEPECTESGGDISPPDDFGAGLGSE